MQDLTRTPKTDPTQIFRQRDSIYAPELFAVALVGLDFFTWLAKRNAAAPATLQAICAELQLARRPVDAMLTLFCAMELLQKKNDAFALTERAREFLVSDSPWFVGPYFSHFNERPIYQSLLETLHTDKPRWAGGEPGKDWAESMLDDAFAQQFTGTMDSRGLYVGPALATALASAIDLKSRRHLLDIAGGSGIYACCVAAANPHLKATVFERPPTDGVTRKAIARRGYSERVNVVTGDMFKDPLPTDCDIHLWSNALHDWDEPTCELLLKKSFAALPAGGVLVVQDRHLNRDKTGSLAVAAHSVFLMASTQGRYYSVGEIEGFLAAAGFVKPQFRETVIDYSIITAVKPAATAA
jgi:O-methyltransferase domain